MVVVEIAEKFLLMVKKQWFWCPLCVSDVNCVRLCSSLSQSPLTLFYFVYAPMRSLVLLTFFGKRSDHFAFRCLVMYARITPSYAC